MKIIEPNARIIKQEPGMEGMYKHIETVGRNCYKSTPKEGVSAKDFVDRLQKSKHGAMLEHGTVYLTVEFNPIDNTVGMMVESSTIIQSFKHNKYSRVNKNDHKYYITTNYRVITEQVNIPFETLEKYICEPTEHHDKRVTIEFTSDRGVSAEANRHRVHSMGEESTRYCNYAKDKFGNEIAIIANEDIDSNDPRLTDFETQYMLKKYCHNVGNLLTANYDPYKNVEDIDDTAMDALGTWLFANAACEWAYLRLINKFGWTPQKARRVLPLDLKSTFCHTAFEDEWETFFDMRVSGSTGAPHPDMKAVAEIARETFVNEKK